MAHSQQHSTPLLPLSTPLLPFKACAHQTTVQHPTATYRLVLHCYHSALNSSTAAQVAKELFSSACQRNMEPPTAPQEAVGSPLSSAITGPSAYLATYRLLESPRSDSNYTISLLNAIFDSENIIGHSGLEVKVDILSSQRTWKILLYHSPRIPSFIFYPSIAYHPHHGATRQWSK